MSARPAGGGESARAADVPAVHPGPRPTLAYESGAGPRKTVRKFRLFRAVCYATVFTVAGVAMVTGSWFTALRSPDPWDWCSVLVQFVVWSVIAGGCTWRAIRIARGDDVTPL